MSSDLDAYGSTTDPSHKSHHAPVPYFMHHSVTEMYAYVHIHVRFSGYRIFDIWIMGFEI